MNTEAEARTRARLKEKAIAAKRVVEKSGGDTRIRFEAKFEVRDRNVGILLDVLNKVNAASN